MTDENSNREEELKKLEKELIADLREEAAEAKKCFTTFSFQTIAFSAAIIGLIFRSLQDNPISSLAAIPGISFLMIVCRIGIYKYQTANRAYGYQFYLEKSGSYEKETESKKAWELIIANRSWEQVFRVWRIIHPTIFKMIYVAPKNGNGLMGILDAINPLMYINTKFANNKINQYETNQAPLGMYPWCFLKCIAKKGINLDGERKIISEYKSGTYLKNMLLILFILQGIFIFTLLLGNFVLFDQYWNDSGGNLVLIHAYDKVWNIFGKLDWVDKTIPVSLIVMSIITVFRIVRTDRRRDIIENELYSIHSCEITWQIVALAHYRATINSNNYFEKDKQKDYNWFDLDRIYLQSINNESEEIIKNLFYLDKWINQTKEEHSI